MEISQYEVIINEKNKTCGFVLNLNFYDLEDFLKSEIKYEVIEKEKKVKVFNDSMEIFFINLTEELIYYAFKTETLIILGGSEEDGGKIKIFSEALLY